MATATTVLGTTRFRSRPDPGRTRASAGCRPEGLFVTNRGSEPAASAFAASFLAFAVLTMIRPYLPLPSGRGSSLRRASTRPAPPPPRCCQSNLDRVLRVRRVLPGARESEHVAVVLLGPVEIGDVDRHLRERGVGLLVVRRVRCRCECTRGTRQDLQELPRHLRLLGLLRRTLPYPTLAGRSSVERFRLR